MTKPLTEQERERLREICPVAIATIPKSVLCKLLALDAENEELKTVLEAEGYRFPEREFPDVIPEEESP